jgi:hypothetical protein
MTVEQFDAGEVVTACAAFVEGPSHRLSPFGGQRDRAAGYLYSVHGTERLIARGGGVGATPRGGHVVRRGSGRWRGFGSAFSGGRSLLELQLSRRPSSGRRPPGAKDARSTDHALTKLYACPHQERARAATAYSLSRSEERQPKRKTGAHSPARADRTVAQACLRSPQVVRRQGAGGGRPRHRHARDRFCRNSSVLVSFCAQESALGPPASHADQRRLPLAPVSAAGGDKRAGIGLEVER